MTDDPRGAAPVAKSDRAGSPADQKETLLKAGALQSAILNSANFSSIATDEKGVIQIFNVGAERMLGYAAADVLNKITPADISDPQEVIARAGSLSAELRTLITPGFEALVFKASRGIEDIYELTYIRKDGSRLPAIVSVTALRDEQDRIIGYLLIGTDNSARERAEIDLRATAAQLEEHAAMLDLSSDAIFVLDFDGVIHFWNTGATALLGYTREEAVGRDSQDLLHPSYPRPFQELQAELRRTGRWSGEASYQHLDGHPIDVALRWAMRTAKRGLTEAVLVSATDISARRLVEQMKDEFVSVVSHELRTPLTAIRGALGLIAGGAVGVLPAEARPMVEIANANVERLGRLVNDILDLQRWDAGEIPLVASDVELGALVDRVLSAMMPMAKSVGVELVADGGSATVRADADRIEQLVMNLVGNAIKFSPRRGQVRVAIGDSEREMRPRDDRRHGGAVARLSVRDAGRGIPADQQDRIFERFAQVDASNTRQRRGSGLGLAICRAIVQQHGGRIWVESVPGEGATFIVTLPRDGARRS